MKIGIDVDSVLADIMTPLNEFHNREYATTFVDTDYVDYNLANVWGCTPEEVYERVYGFYHSPEMETIPLMPQAQEGVAYLKDKGYGLVVITSRPEVTKASTLRWLNKHFPDMFDEVVLSNQFSNTHTDQLTKGEIGRKLGIEAMVDDHLGYALDCQEKGIQAYLFEAPWNEQLPVPPEIVRVSGWEELGEYF